MAKRLEGLKSQFSDGEIKRFDALYLHKIEWRKDGKRQHTTLCSYRRLITIIGDVRASEVIIRRDKSIEQKTIKRMCAGSIIITSYFRS